MEGRFDLIWCGSLLTHLDREDWSGFLRFFESVLVPGGVLLFTTHGRFAADRLRNSIMRFGVAPDEIEGFVADFDREGFGFRDYPHLKGEGLGVSLASPAWVSGLLEECPSLHLLFYSETGHGRAWSGQDLVGCVLEPQDRYRQMVMTAPDPGKHGLLT